MSDGPSFREALASKKYIVRTLIFQVGRSGVDVHKKYARVKDKKEMEEKMGSK